jgi:hypothetical protein
MKFDATKEYGWQGTRKEETERKNDPTNPV